MTQAPQIEFIWLDLSMAKHTTHVMLSISIHGHTMKQSCISPSGYTLSILIVNDQSRHSEMTGCK